jgi:hypothetical protein
MMFRLWFVGSVSRRSDYGCYNTIEQAKAAVCDFDDLPNIVEWRTRERSDIVLYDAYAEYGAAKLQILDESLYQEWMQQRRKIITESKRQMQAHDEESE